MQLKRKQKLGWLYYNKASMNKKLSPLKNRGKSKLKQLRQKQKSWVLDCVNQQKSKLKPYSSMKDRYLKYFVVRVPKKIRNFSKTTPEETNQVVGGQQFKNFLDAKKQKIMESQQSLGNKNITHRSSEQLTSNSNNNTLNSVNKMNYPPNTQKKHKKMSCQILGKSLPAHHETDEKKGKNENWRNQNMEGKTNQMQLRQVANHERKDDLEKENREQKKVQKQYTKERIISQKIEEQYQQIQQKIVKKIR